MLTLILEIYLTVKAWGKGWGARALWPIGLGLAAGFLFGLAMGDSEVSAEGLLVMGLLVDGGVIGALVLMVANPPAPALAGGQVQPLPEPADGSATVPATTVS